jgi:hypothetical protein
MSDDMTLDDLTVVGIDGIRRSFDEHYDTMMCVEQDPTGAHHAILNQHARIEELEKQNASLEAKLASLVPALSYEGMRTDEAEAKLAIAMVGLVQSRDELDQYSQEEYPSDHPVHERCRKRDYDANPARIAIAKIKGEQP